MKIEPIGHKLIINPEKVAEVTTGGIILTDTSLGDTRKGEVVYAGKGTKELPMTVKEGDTVMYPHYAGHEMEIGGIKHLLMTEHELIGIVRT